MSVAEIDLFAISHTRDALDFTDSRGFPYDNSLNEPAHRDPRGRLRGVTTATRLEKLLKPEERHLLGQP